MVGRRSFAFGKENEGELCLTSGFFLVDCMNASSFIEIIEIALHHIGDDVPVVLMTAEFEGTTVRARGVQLAQDCFGCHYFGYRPPKGKKIYIYINIYIYIQTYIYTSCI